MATLLAKAISLFFCLIALGPISVDSDDVEKPKGVINVLSLKDGEYFTSRMEEESREEECFVHLFLHPTSSNRNPGNGACG